MLKMDLKKFKKISHDDNCTVMRNREGHEIRIAHKALSPAMREQLKNLPMHKAKGGEVNPKLEQSRMADGGKVKKQTETGIPGGPGSPAIDQSSAEAIEKGATSRGTSLSEGWKNVKKELGFAEGGNVDEEDHPASVKQMMMDKITQMKDHVLSHLDDVNQQIKDASADQVARIQAIANPNMVGPKLPQEPLPAENQMAQNAIQGIAGSVSPVGKIPFHMSAAMEKLEQPMIQNVGQAIERGSIPGKQYVQEIAAKRAIREAAKKAPQKVARYAYGTPDVSESDVQEVDLPPAPEAPAQEVNLPPAASPTPVPAPVNPNAQPLPQVPSPQQAVMPQPAQMQQAMVPAAPPQQAPSPEAQDIMNMPNAVDAYMKGNLGIKKEAEAMGELGRQQAAIEHEAQQKMQAQQELYNQNYKELENERMALQQDIKNGHVDPDKYWENHSKLMAGIGIILGGFNPTSRPNAAMEFINNQIDRSIKAQAQNLESKQNLLRANIQQFGNMNTAAQYSRALMQDQVASQLREQAAKMQDPLAKARALSLSANLEQQIAPVFQQIALNRTIQQLNSAPQQPAAQGVSPTAKVEQALPLLRLLKPEVAKEMEGRLVPGVGVASIPVPNEIRGSIMAKQDLDRSLRKFHDWAQKHGGSVDPKIVNEGKAMAAEIQSMYRNAINGGVFKKGEQEFIDTIIDSDPTKFFGKMRVLPKIEEVARSNAQQLNNLKANYGLPKNDFQDLKTYTFADHPGAVYIKRPDGSYQKVK